jgi:hypothetical protein
LNRPEQKLDLDNRYVLKYKENGKDCKKYNHKQPQSHSDLRSADGRFAYPADRAARGGGFRIVVETLADRPGPAVNSSRNTMTVPH